MSCRVGSWCCALCCMVLWLKYGVLRGAVVMMSLCCGCVVLSCRVGLCCCGSYMLCYTVLFGVLLCCVVVGKFAGCDSVVLQLHYVVLLRGIAFRSNTLNYSAYSSSLHSPPLRPSRFSSFSPSPSIFSPLKTPSFKIYAPIFSIFFVHL